MKYIVCFVAYKRFFLKKKIKNLDEISNYYYDELKVNIKIFNIYVILNIDAKSF